MLFIDARKLGFMVDRTRKEFSDADIARIADTYHAWRLGEGYADVPGFCKSASIDEIRSHGHVLTPSRYAGAEAAEEDEMPFAERFATLQEQLEAQFAEAEELTTTIRVRLAGIGGVMQEALLADLLTSPVMANGGTGNPRQVSHRR